MKILDFGSANIDFVYSLDMIVKPGETVQSREIHTFPGGKGLNQAVAIARAGAECYFAGTVGQDGLFLKQLLKDSGVNTDLMKVSAQKTGHAIIQLENSGLNSIIISHGANYDNDIGYIDRVLSFFSPGDYLILQNEISNLSAIIDKAHAIGMTIFLNPSPMDDTLRSLDFGKLSYLILNETEALELAGGEDVNTFLKVFPERYPHLGIVLTLGEKGSIYIGNGSQLHCMAYLVESVDSTAAGDTYTGYFVASLAEGMAVEAALRTASAAAALAVSRMGAAVSIPKQGEVEHALDTLPRRESEAERIAENLDRYLEHHLQDASLKEFAASIGYSCDYIGKQIGRLTGKRFITLLQEKRCAEAEKLLRTTSLSAGEIASRVGYNNESYFYQVFRREYGKTPFAWRRDLVRNKLKKI